MSFKNQNRYKNSEAYEKDIPLLKRNAWLLAVAWSLILTISLIWNWHEENNTVHELALKSLNLSFEKDVVYRLWAARHGGVYVPVAEDTPPNPYLSHLPERDIVTPSGRPLTLVNPAYMTRQVHELGRERYGIRGHITSLNPLRPENVPDEWERQALHRFEKAEEEVVTIMEIDGQPFMRLMRPFVTEQGCLKCHGHQGYQVGDIRGGISVSYPISFYLLHAKSRQKNLLIVHGMIWLAGLFMIGFSTFGIISLRRNVEKKRRISEEKIGREAVKLQAQLTLYELADAPPDRLMDLVLGAIREVTRSSFAFIGIVDQAEEVLTIHKWTENAMKKCAVNKHPMHFPVSQAGLWGECVRRRALFIENNYKDSKEKKGYPAEHVPIERFMCVPFFQRGKIVMVAAVANKAEDYSDQESNDIIVLIDRLYGILQQRNADNALCESEKRLVEAQRIAGMGDFIMNWETGDISWSDALYALLRYDRADKPDFATVDARIHHPDDAERINRWLQDCVASGSDRLTPNEYRIIRKDGEVIYVRTVGVIQRNEDNKITLFGTVLDITEQKRAEEHKILKRKFESMETLSGWLAHDMNNLLAALIGNIEMADRLNKNNIQIKECLADALAAGFGTRDLIKRFMTMTPFLMSRKVGVSLPELIQKNLTSLHPVDDIDILFNCGEGIWVVDIDESLIDSVVKIIIENALEAMPRGGVLEIAVENVSVVNKAGSQGEMLTDGDYAKVLFKDTGVGISGGNLKKVFDPYFSTKERGTQKGQGLSLTLAYSIIMQHEGHIGINSKEGEGTEVTLWLHRGEKGE